MIEAMEPWFEKELQLDPAVPLDVAARGLPARWAVYLMADEAGRPVQLLSVRNLRASVKRRLTEFTEGPSKRVDYRTLVRRIYWRRVDSALESDLTYLRVAKTVFPDTYQKIVSARQAWFVHVDPGDDFPRWVRTDDPTLPCGTVLGPMLERAHANRLIERLEDLFDLCRYHHILLQSPIGKPCAYKEMGKCPAPCDGSVSMQQYRSLIDWSLRTLIDPEQEIEEQQQRMRDASGELRFELAGKIKQFADALAELRQQEFKYVRAMQDFRYLSLQPGPGRGQVKLFVITPDDVRCVACLRTEPRELMLRIDELRQLAEPRRARATVDPDRLGIVARHLLVGKSGIFIHGDELDDRAIVAAYKQLSKKSTPAIETEDEGVVTASAELN
jgi:hypothetical protein